MTKRLYSLSLGETLREQFLADAAQYPYGEVLYLVPNRILEHLVKARGVVKTLSLDALAGEILKENTQGTPLRRISRQAQKKILEEALAVAVEGGQVSYFAQLVKKKGFLDSLLNLFNEFAQNSLAPEQFNQILVSWGRPGKLGKKDREMALIYLLFVNKLREQQVTDLSGRYQLAVEALQQGGTVPWQKCYISEFNQLSSVQLELVEALGDLCDVEIGLFYDPSRPELSAVTENIHAQLVGAGFADLKEAPQIQRPADLDFFAQNWRGSDYSRPEAEHIHLAEAGTPEQEMRLVLTQIKKKLQSGTAPQDILLLMRSTSDYPGLARAFALYGLETTMPTVTGAASQPLPDLITKLLQAVSQPQDLGAWQNLFRCTLLPLLWDCQRDALEQDYTQLYFERAGALRSHVKRERRINDEFWTDLAFFQADHTAKEWQEGMQDLLDRWNLMGRWGSLHQAGKVDLAQVKLMGNAVELVKHTFEMLERTWEDCGQKAAAVTPAQLLEFWQDSLKGATLILKEGNPQGISVMEAGDIQGVSYPYVFIMGLRDGLFPSVKRESWLYNDGERTELNGLGVELAVSGRSLEADRFFFASAAAIAAQDLYLSWYRDEEGGPSPYIQELLNLYAEGSLVPQTFYDSLDNCASEALLEQLLMQQEALALKEQAFLAKRLGSDYAQRAATGKKRWEDPESPWNGTVPGILKETLRLSASGLDVYLQCPFAYLFGNVWKMEPWEEQTGYPGPDVVGSLLHAVLAEFLSRHLSKALSFSDLPQLRDELQQVFADQFEALVQSGKISQSSLLPHLRKVYGSWLSNWLKQECEYEQTSSLLPSKLEWSFGRKDSPWRALCRYVDDKPVYFSGQVDRIDTNGTTYAILDYKTGQHPSGSQIKDGKAVQLPLYARALMELGPVDPQNILGGGYCSLRSGKREGGTWSPEAKKYLDYLARSRAPKLEESMEKAFAEIDKAVRALRQGAFPAAPYGSCPPYCPAKDVCRISENPKSSEQEQE